MKKILEVALGIVTSIGGFLDAGALATAIAAGAVFGYAHLWVFLLGTICVIFLVEMSGRLTAVSKHTLVAAIRERFGWKFHSVLYVANLMLDYLVLASEIGGVCIALQLITGISFQWWAFPVGFVVWLVLWRGNFSFIEDGVAMLGLVTLCFVVAAFRSHAPINEVARGYVPSLPKHNAVGYWYVAVGILGALISPYLFYFYSSGAREDEWDKKYLGANRVVAGMGMGFGSTVAMSVLIVAAVVLHPLGIAGDNYHQAAFMLVPTLGYWGFILFAMSLGIACMGAALEVALDCAYDASQTFGWNWGESKKPHEAARFSAIYTVFLPLAVLPIALGLDPLKLTLFSMAITAVVLPLVTIPFLLLMNDETYVGEHRNNWLGNCVVIFTIALSFVLGIVAIPLEFLGG